MCLSNLLSRLADFRLSQTPGQNQQYGSGSLKSLCRSKQGNFLELKSCLNKIKHYWYSYYSASVTKYTREAGVRTLERHVAAICRAVAVKVMESRSRRKQEMDGNGEGKDDVMSKEEVFKVSEKDEEATMMHPPEMPIVIDEVAVEDILGVSYQASLPIWFVSILFGKTTQIQEYDLFLSNVELVLFGPLTDWVFGLCVCVWGGGMEHRG